MKFLGTTPAGVPTTRPGWLTPFNVVTGLILAFGGAVVIFRFAFGLGEATFVDNTTPWGLWTGFKMVFVACAAGGFTLTTAVYLFRMHEYHDLVRPAVLSGFIGYTLFILILIFDLGRPWRIYYPFFVQPGPTSALFEIALCVALYYTTQFLELTPVGFEWLGWRKWRRGMVAVTVGLTIFGLLLSTLHQSTLGALYLIAPTKLHPLWYSPYIPLHFFLTAVVAGISMVVFVGRLSKGVFGAKMGLSRERLDKLTVGLGKGGALALATYLAVRLIDISLAAKWSYLFSSYGVLFLFEVLGLGLVPCLLYLVGYRERRPGLVRLASVLAILGVVTNRLNVGVYAFNWDLASSPVAQGMGLTPYRPMWTEYVVVAFLITLGVVAYKVVSRWVPIVNEHPEFKESHH